MKNFLRHFRSYVFGPSLYIKYDLKVGSTPKLYKPDRIEVSVEELLSTFGAIWYTGRWLWPLVMLFFLISMPFAYLVKFTCTFYGVLLMGMIVRGYVRSRSGEYADFVRFYAQLGNSSKREEAIQHLRGFDFEFAAWPVSFDVASIAASLDSSLRYTDWKQRAYPLSKRWDLSIFTLDAKLPGRLLAYFALHTFGIRFIYMGCIHLLQRQVWTQLLHGRYEMVCNYGAQRHKIKAIDRNEIDSLVVDNRGVTANGEVLIICCEGSNGFCETGNMKYLLKLKYSVLGWNYPGFEGGSGRPFPDQVENAIDAVMLFAIHHLRFSVQNIVLYGYSIGGFSALSAALNYPYIRGVVLDDTFDDILSEAKLVMPRIFFSVLEIAFRDYCSMNNVDLIERYLGPILIIQRNQDFDGVVRYISISSLLQQRYPNVFRRRQVAEINKFLMGSESIYNQTYTLSEEHVEKMSALIRTSIITQFTNDFYPMALGENFSEPLRDEMAVFLFKNHFCSVKLDHFEPLPLECFEIPWDILDLVDTRVEGCY